MAIGYATGADANAYLLIGVPLTVAFQKAVRRKPLRDLWIRDGEPVVLGGKATLLAILLMIGPVALLVSMVVAREWVVAAWAAAATVGAVPAAYAARHLRATGGPAWAWAGVAIVAGWALVIATAVTAGSGALSAARVVLVVVEALVLYVPVGFVLEEVTFRGLIDTHVAEAAPGWPSAVGVSALWGLWHLPITGAGDTSAAVVAQLLVVHVAVGVPLSLAWRRSGNLGLPVVGHAVVNAARNALLGG